ncbi:MAG TPA: alpha/beta hydrolase [Methanocella sp.]|nr:alpha/beta hydrolase [Methanocella sp.]
MELVTSSITSSEHWVGDKIRLYMWEKYWEKPSGKPVVVLAHGSSTAGRESFDLCIPEKPSYSLMGFLAMEGFDVFAPDIRGFGRSTRPEGYMTTADASEDLNAAVDYVLNLRDVQRVNLLGWSWGTQYAGMFVATYPEKVDKYISYGQMCADSPGIASRRLRIGEFRESPYERVSEAGWRSRFYLMTPAEASDPEVVDRYVRAAVLAGAAVPTGPQVDLATRLPMVSPSSLTVPTMIIHGEFDDVADAIGLSSFYQEIPGRYKRYVIIPGAGHMMHLQRNHQLFQREVALFFKTEQSALPE